MKFITLIFVLIFAGSLTSCGKRHTLAEVELNCTGTYFSVQERTYRVCNEEKLSGFESGDVIDVHFRIVDECKNLDQCICLMAFEYDATVEILSVN